MTAVLAPSAPLVPATRAPQGADLPARSPAPRLTFRSVLLQEDPHPLRSSAEPPKPSAHSPPCAQRMARACASPLRGAQQAESASAALPQRGLHRDEDDPLDPLRRHRAAPDLLSLPPPSPAMPEPLGGTTPPGSFASGVRAASSLEDLLPTLVRRIAWSGNGQRGTVRLELGAGELAGGTLVVHAEDGHVSVHLDVPPGADARQWQQRIRNRLASRGVATDSVEVT